MDCDADRLGRSRGNIHAAVLPCVSRLLIQLCCAVSSLAALEAYFVSNGQRIRDFNGGEVELSVPYQAIGAIRAWYLKEDGTCEPVSVRYDKENARLILRHFSHYVIEELDSSTAYTACAKDHTCPLAAFGDLTTTGAVSFGDVADGAWYAKAVSEYAIPAMQWACGSGLMTGVAREDGTFLAPADTTVRVQTVILMMRFQSALAKAA